MEALKRKRNKKGVGGKLFFLTFYFVLGYGQLTYNVVIVLGEHQRDSAIHIHVKKG